MNAYQKAIDYCSYYIWGPTTIWKLDITTESLRILKEKSIKFEDLKINETTTMLQLNNLAPNILEYVNQITVPILQDYIDDGSDDAEETVITKILSLSTTNIDDIYFKVFLLADILGLSKLKDKLHNTFNSISKLELVEIRKTFKIEYEDFFETTKPEVVLINSEKDNYVDIYDSDPSRRYKGSILEKLKKREEKYGICTLCDNDLCMKNGNHHCRICARGICGSCCTYREIPEGARAYFYETNYIKAKAKEIYRGGTEPVCLECTPTVTKSAFFLMGISLISLNKIAYVSSKWHTSALHVIGHLRLIQYNVPFHKLTPYEKAIIWANRQNFVGHDYWIIQLIQSTDWTDANETKELLNIIKMRATHQCFETLCTSKCSRSNKFNPEDILFLFKTASSNSTVIEFLIENSLKNITEEELSCYIPFLVDCLNLHIEKEQPLADFLLKRARDSSISFVKDLYWCILYHLKGVDIEDDQYRMFYENLLILLNSRGIKQKIDDTRKFVSYTIYINDRLEAIKKLNQFYSPFNLDIKCTTLVDCEVMNSNSRPVKIKYETDNGYLNILAKTESVRNDQIVSILCKRVNQILKNNEATNSFQLLTYDVLPTSENTGLVQMVPDAITLDKVDGIWTYLALSNSEELKTAEVSKNFERSLAVYSVVSYLLGFGDRHLGNILITKNGNICHIDFGWMVGKEPINRILTSNKPRIPDVVSKAGIDMNKVVDYTTTVYMTLRKHYSLFITLLSLVNYTRSDIESHVKCRFLIGVPDDKAKEEIKKLLETDGYFDKLLHIFHNLRY